jgi:hypothetical protein
MWYSHVCAKKRIVVRAVIAFLVELASKDIAPRTGVNISKLYQAIVTAQGRQKAIWPWAQSPFLSSFPEFTSHIQLFGKWYIHNQSRGSYRNY